MFWCACYGCQACVTSSFCEPVSKGMPQYSCADSRRNKASMSVIPRKSVIPWRLAQLVGAPSVLCCRHPCSLQSASASSSARSRNWCTAGCGTPRMWEASAFLRSVGLTSGSFALGPVFKFDPLQCKQLSEVSVLKPFSMWNSSVLHMSIIPGFWSAIYSKDNKTIDGVQSLSLLLRWIVFPFSFLWVNQFLLLRWIEDVFDFCLISNHGLFHGLQWGYCSKWMVPWEQHFYHKKLQLILVTHLSRWLWKGSQVL